jgi:anti-anti-sigma regulatory factor
MLVVNLQPAPRRVFEMLGLDDMLRYDRRAS